MIEHKGIEYEFRYLELSRLVQITKGDTFTYEMRLKGRLFVCNCPGYKYWGKCWHRSVIDELLQVPTVDEPWAWWAEKAQIGMMYGKFVQNLNELQ